jgi:hypothetical protein
MAAGLPQCAAGRPAAAARVTVWLWFRHRRGVDRNNERSGPVRFGTWSGLVPAPGRSVRSTPLARPGGKYMPRQFVYPIRMRSALVQHYRTSNLG